MSRYQPNRAESIQACVTRIEALDAHVVDSAITKISVDGTAYTPAEIIEVFDRCIGAHEALAEHRAQEKDLMAACAAAEKRRRQFDTALKPWAIHQFGDFSDEVKDFGFAPPAPRGTKDGGRAVVGE